MDTMMKHNPVGAERITIRCKANPNWIRISIMTLISTLIAWLAFGLFCSLADGCLGFGQALVTPIALIFAGMIAVACFLRIRKMETEVTGHIGSEVELV